MGTPNPIRDMNGRGESAIERQYRCPFMNKRVGDFTSDGAFEMLCRGCRQKCMIRIEKGKITLNNKFTIIPITQ